MALRWALRLSCNMNLSISKRDEVYTFGILFIVNGWWPDGGGIFISPFIRSYPFHVIRSSGTAAWNQHVAMNATCHDQSPSAFRTRLYSHPFYWAVGKHKAYLYIKWNEFPDFPVKWRLVTGQIGTTAIDCPTPVRSMQWTFQGENNHGSTQGAKGKF